MADQTHVGPDGLDWPAVYRRLAEAEVALQQADRPDPARLLEIWHARARLLAKPLADERDTASGGAEAQWVIFLLAQERYAVSVTHVLEIQPIEELTYVPNTPAHIAGLVILRGRVLTLVDLRALFNLPRQGLTEISRVLVVQAAGMQVGLLADEVLAVVTLAAHTLDAPLAHLSGARAAYLHGVTSDMTAVLDLNTLLGDPRLMVHDEVPG